MITNSQIILLITVALMFAQVRTMRASESLCADRLARAVRSLRASTEAAGWIRIQCVTSAMKSSGGVGTDTLTITSNGTFKMTTTKADRIVEDASSMVIIMSSLKRIYVASKGHQKTKQKKNVVDEFLDYIHEGRVTTCSDVDSVGMVDVEVTLPPTKTKKNAVSVIRVQLTKDDVVRSVTYQYNKGSDYRYASMGEISVRHLSSGELPAERTALRYVFTGKNTVKEEYKKFQITDINSHK